ncbi:hemoglobin [Crenobacter luteus]|uniref:group III truncated hemoglobin n=1 Tax=Crenobacter luteus TaxID=1452487 RepID=UPI001050847F|nr:group III truncated hemoglobin [Crenobacter luteus]TCP13637.1 hemoglobin [Crenobacter luteus]
MKDIAQDIGRATVDAVVADFYTRVRAHPRLSIPFARVADWPRHEAHIAHFWWTSLGGERYLDVDYRVGPKHVEVGVTDALLDDWLALFAATLADHLPDELAAPWYERAARIGQSLLFLAAFAGNPHGGAPGGRA